MRKVLITGGTGFIGRQCLPLFKDLGYEVYATYHTKPRDEMEDVHWVKCDITDEITVNKILSTIRPTHLLHLAWNLKQKDYLNSEENLNQLKGSLFLVEKFVQNGGWRIVTAGTCFEYGVCKQKIQEDYEKLSDASLYAVCKSSMFRILQLYLSQQKVQYAHGRIFYTFGPNENPRRVVPYVIEQLLQGQNPRCSACEQILDYMYVGDVANALIQLLDSEVQGAVNIGSGEGTKLKDMLLFIEKRIGGEGHIEFAEPDGKAIHSIVADNTKLMKCVDWKQTLTVEESLRQMITQMKR